MAGVLSCFKTDTDSSVSPCITKSESVYTKERLRMRVCFAALLLLTAGIVSGDIPDCTLQWDCLSVIENQGNDILLDCIMSDDCSSFKLVFSSLTEDGRELWLLELDNAGEIMSRTELLSDQIDQAEWVLPGFIDESTVAIAYGYWSRICNAEFLIVDLTSQDNVKIISLSGLFPDDSVDRITSIEPSGTDQMILVGSSRTSEQISSLFVAAMDLDGRVIWRIKLFESRDYVLAGSLLKLLDDGGCILMYREDYFPSEGIHIYRLDAGGREVWKSLIELDCEYAAGFSDFTELDNGNILCSGGFDKTGGRFAYRGILVCLDSSGEEVWRREDWYQDHTSFVSAEPVPEGGLMLTGWTGVEGDYEFEIIDMDVLIANLDATGESIIGFLIEEHGDQNPRFVYEMGEGEYFIVGEHTPDGSDESDIFLGRVIVPL